MIPKRGLQILLSTKIIHFRLIQTLFQSDDVTPLIDFLLKQINLYSILFVVNYSHEALTAPACAIKALYGMTIRLLSGVIFLTKLRAKHRYFRIVHVEPLYSFVRPLSSIHCF